MRPSRYRSRTRDDLTERQRDVLALVAKGKTNREVADALGMTLDGAKFHVSEILSKLDVSTREEAAERWREQRGIKRRAVRGLKALWSAPLGRILVAGSGLVLAVAVSGGIFLALSGSSPAESGTEDMAFVFDVYDLSGEARRIVTYDATRHTTVGSFAAPRAGTIATGHDIFTGIQRQQLSTVTVDGTQTPLYSAPDGEEVMSVAVSPDGRTVALEQRTDRAGADDDAVVLISMASRQVLQTFRVAELVPEVPTATTADGVRWSSDSETVTIRLPLPGTSNVPYPQTSQAVVLGVDGSVRNVPLDAMAVLSPDGSMVAEGAPLTADCVGFGGTHEFRIVDLRTGQTLSSVDDAAAGLRGLAWMPDSSGFVYTSSGETGCAQGGSDSTWWLLPTTGEAHQLPGDPSAQMSNPAVSRISWSCGGQSQHFGQGVIVTSQWVGEVAACAPLSPPVGAPTPTPGPPMAASLTVDGHHVLDALSITLIGEITLAR